MLVIETIEALRAWRHALPSNEKVALVPTMGNLHEGHLALVNAAKAHAEHVVLSIFVNGLQFGAGEDFSTYPRTLKADCDKLNPAGVAVVFCPTDEELYPDGFATVQVEPPAIQNELCGTSRPGHFRGVATIVCKLFNIVQPDIACFGRKDYQQLHIIRLMVKDLNFPVEILSVAIVRAPDGLALSSRNGYLSASERARAPQLSQALRAMADAVLNGNLDFAALIAEATKQLTAQGWRVDYLSIRETETLLEAGSHAPRLVILGAARIGSTRLIDNLEVDLADRRID